MAELTRRSFLSGAAAMGVAAAAPLSMVSAIGPIPRPARQRLRLSLAAFSFRDYLPSNRGGGKPPAKEPAMDMLTFIDWCGGQDLDAVEPTAYFFPDPVPASFINAVKLRAHHAGLDLSSGAIGNRFTLPPGPELDAQFEYVTTWINHYADMGVTNIRVFAGNPPKGMSEEEAIRLAIPNLRKACTIAGKRGVILALENHDFTVTGDRMRQLVDAIDSPWFGVCLDTGNFRSEDPYADIEAIAPYAVNVQVKCDIKPVGRPKEPADLDRIMRIIKKSGYSGYIVLEYEEKEDPYEHVPYWLAKLRKAIETA